MANVAPAPHVTVSGDTAGVKLPFLQEVMQAVAAVGGTAIRVVSGRRTPGENTAAGGAARSNHLTGDAVDGSAYIPGQGWVPLGTALQSVAPRFGLRSGATFNWNGKPDVVHVDDGANQPGGTKQPAAGTPTGGTPFPDGSSVADYIGARAGQLGLDPLAVLAVAKSEGGLLAGGKPGDHGTSFGPFQMRVGGALPTGLTGQRAQAWAWSPAGIDYALTRMAGVAGGSRGVAAIRNIVHRFEKPLHPAQEVTTASGYYTTLQAAAAANPNKSSSSFWSAVTGYIGNAIGSTPVPIPGLGIPGLTIPGVDVGGIPGAITSTADFLGKLTDPSYILRGLQIVAGAGLVLTGAVLLVRQVALAADLPDPLAAGLGAATRRAPVPPPAVEENLKPRPVYGGRIPGAGSAQNRDGIPF